MLTEEQKSRINSLTNDEMAYEINLGRRSRFQREKFAYLKTAYDKCMSNNMAYREQDNYDPKPNNPYTTVSQETKSHPPTQITKIIHNPRFMLFDKTKKGIDLIHIAEGVIIGVLVLFIGWICLHYFSIHFK